MIHYRINREERLVAIRFAGEVPLENSLLVFERMLAECPESPAFDSVNDLRAQTSALRTPQVMEMSRFNKRLGLQEHDRRSVVLVADTLNFGVSRMFEQLTEHESRVKRLTTRSIAAAAEFLGRPEEVLRRELDALGAEPSPPPG